MTNLRNHQADSHIVHDLCKSKMASNSTYYGAQIAASRTFSAAAPSQSETPTATATFDSHTIPIIFGTIGAVLGTIAIIVTVAFGVLQLRSLNRRKSGDAESGAAASRITDAVSKPEAAASLTVAHQQSQVDRIPHESVLSSYVSLRHLVTMFIVPQKLAKTMV